MQYIVQSMVSIDVEIARLIFLRSDFESVGGDLFES